MPQHWKEYLLQEFSTGRVPDEKVHITFGGVSSKYVGAQEAGDVTSCGVRVVHAIESILFYDEADAVTREQDDILTARWTYGALVLLSFVLSALMSSRDGTRARLPRAPALGALTPFLDSQPRRRVSVRVPMEARLVALWPALKTLPGQEALGCQSATAAMRRRAVSVKTAPTPLLTANSLRRKLQSCQQWVSVTKAFSLALQRRCWPSSLPQRRSGERCSNWRRYRWRQAQLGAFAVSSTACVAVKVRM